MFLIMGSVNNVCIGTIMWISMHLFQVVSKEYAKDTDIPSNGVTIVGCLVPVFLHEEAPLRRLFRKDDDGDSYNLDWKGMHISKIQFSCLWQKGV